MLDHDTAHSDGSVGILPPIWGRINHHHTPYWGVALFLAVSAALIAGLLHRLWVKAGRPREVRDVSADVEHFE